MHMPYLVRALPACCAPRVTPGQGPVTCFLFADIMLCYALLVDAVAELCSASSTSKVTEGLAWEAVHAGDLLRLSANSLLCPDNTFTCVGATLGFLVLLGIVALIVRCSRRKRRFAPPPSPVYISHSETVRNPALRHLGRVHPLTPAGASSCHPIMMSCASL